MITIEQPAMVLNAVDPTLPRFQMWNTWDISYAESPEHIINWVAQVAKGVPTGKLKNVIFQCHGLPGKINIGTGLGREHVHLFQRWRGLVNKIWIVACETAFMPPGSTITSFSNDGHSLISEIARAARCYVVAATELQYFNNRTYPFGVIDSFEGLVLSYGPAGNITWSQRYPTGAYNGE
jgi:hypothetical protein